MDINELTGMNVKPGDVAIIIMGRLANIGRLVYVASGPTDNDYTKMGYGILPSWVVESLGSDLDTNTGPSQRGFTPDISLRRLDLLPEQTTMMRKIKAERDFEAALAELAVVLADAFNEAAKKTGSAPAETHCQASPVETRV